MIKPDKIIRPALLLLLLWLAPDVCPAQRKPGSSPTLPDRPFSARVTGITDGDTLEILYNGQPVKVRLSHIDSPERSGGQPFWQEAKQALSALCFGQQVTVHPEKRDRYKRLIATIINADKIVVNEQMVRQGMAWHFSRYSNSRQYAALETTARLKRAGLWQDTQPVAPWVWRKQKHRRMPAR
ncbi:thermonuclease family protein [Pedobacter yulinensis]|uniref:thermonuclease family protein n=1 Tax=Pedobacter yulinensis TaxID=2126353 RepID=UPI001EF79EEF|nr:thermonuclease family protein [Pedobacter yulinensis]